MEKGEDDWDVSASARIGLKCTVEKLIFFYLPHRNVMDSNTAVC